LLLEREDVRVDLVLRPGWSRFRVGSMQSIVFVLVKVPESLKVVHFVFVRERVTTDVRASLLSDESLGIKKGEWRVRCNGASAGVPSWNGCRADGRGDIGDGGTNCVGEDVRWSTDADDGRSSGDRNLCPTDSE